MIPWVCKWQLKDEQRFGLPPLNFSICLDRTSVNAKSADGADTNTHLYREKADEWPDQIRSTEHISRVDYCGLFLFLQMRMSVSWVSCVDTHIHYTSFTLSTGGM